MPYSTIRENNMDENILSLNSQYDEFTLKLDRAKKLLESEKINEAKSILLTIIAANPYHIDANDLLSRIYEFQENYDQAAKSLERLLSNVDSLSLRYKLAQTYQEADDYYNAYRVLKSLCDEVDGDKNLFEQMAHTCAILDKTDEAVEFYDKILQIDKDDIVALGELSDIYYETDKTNYYFLKARICKLEKNFSQAIEAYKKVLKLLDDGNQKKDVHHQLAKLYHEVGKYDNAYDEYMHVLEYDPDNEQIKEEMDRISEEAEFCDQGGFLNRIFKMLFNS